MCASVARSMPEEVASSTIARGLEVATDPTSLTDIAAVVMEMFNYFTTESFMAGPFMVLLASLLLAVLRYPLAREWLDRIDGDQSDWLRTLLLFISAVVATVGAGLVSGGSAASVVAAVFALFGRDAFQNLYNEIVKAIVGASEDEVD